MSDFNSMRINMVNNQIKPFAVTDTKILDAFGEIPRENFSQYSNEAIIYSDNIVYLSNKKKHFYSIGTMSGTSFDGVDAALIKTDGRN